MTVGGGDGDSVDGLVDEVADVSEDFFAIKRAIGQTDRREGGADDEAEMRVARGLAAGFGFGGDALDVGGRDEAAQTIVGIDDEHFVNTDVGGEEAVGGGDGILRGGGGGLGDEGGARGHHFGDAFGFVALFDDVAGEEPGETASGVDDGERGKRETLGLDHGQDVADEQIGSDGNGVLNEAVDVAFDAGDFLHLLLGRHVVVNETEAAVERHGDGHAGLGDGVHVRGNDRNVESQRFGERRGGVSRLGENLRVERGERDVVEREGRGQVGAEESVSREIKFSIGRGGVERGGRGNLGHDCHERSRAGGDERKQKFGYGLKCG